MPLKDILFSLYLRSGYLPVRDAMRATMGRAHAVVLCYHRVGERDVLTTTPEKFRRDMEYLKSRYQCLPLSELCERLRSGEPLSQPIAAVTFDDGYRDNFTQAVPILQAIGVPATFFVATGFMSTNRVFDHDKEDTKDYPKMTWDDLRTMQADGFEIGSHTVNHADLGRVDATQLRHEMCDSAETLNRELGVRPRAFAFPYGKPQNMTPQAIELAREAGYYAVMSAYGGDNGRGTHGFPLQRVDAGNGLAGWTAWKARVAGLDPDYLRLKLQRRI